MTTKEMKIGNINVLDKVVDPFEREFGILPVFDFMLERFVKEIGLIEADRIISARFQEKRSSALKRSLEICDRIRMS